MKQGKSLTELAREIERQVKTKKDYLADTSAISMTNDLRFSGINGSIGINNLAHEQIAGRVGIPAKYYEKMRTNSPELLAQNVNHWFKKEPERRLIRTLDGNARAFLSDRFRPIDNFDVAGTTLPFISESGCQIQSCELTDKRMYLKAVTPKVQVEIKKGDIVQAGIIISNSEVGCGSVRIEQMIYRLVCLNGMIAADHALRKYHVGKNLEDNDLFTAGTIQADNKAFLMKVHDIVKAALTFTTFNIIINKMREAAEQKITGDPIILVEKTANHFGLKDEERNGVLKHLIEGGDLSKYGLLNAVTRESQDVEDYDRATELEKFGGEVLELQSTTWKAFNS